ncbi:SAM-dependent methyltransferase [Candidatus Trichorickettsia mobilis]|uniref:SAM-dependent methyltransferase n=1 Tax=Candidatus Trichorickettsia mobilis TaxID=1346319 RepID=A0ABZ0UVX4_9RICK|nr:class I SAM-dependent methyltransferase [Candidatus Trichorickettsia mobilis]WPY00772.1 SAM-dependent methyltransferase [Candidatus Trichorickettsia mobilis]
MKDLLAVQEHYQDYPYPLRDPEEETQRLLHVTGEGLPELNHHLYCGKEDFKSGFRVLIAGGGTGDASTFLGEQLKNTNAEIIYLDFSKASMEIAQKRAEVRGLKNITWIHDSILNIPKLALGKFDFINCSGVLHHLASPDEGLKILSDSLSTRGGMHLMIYAKYGRAGVYQIQHLMKLINSDVSSRAEEIENCKAIIEILPDTNWYAKSQDFIADHILFGDIGLYDMFLHKQDRAYSIPEMYEFVNAAGLHFVDFASPKQRLKLEIEQYIKDAELLLQIKQLDIHTQQAISELIVGTVVKHDFYVSKNQNTVADLACLNNIPYFYPETDLVKQVYNFIDSGQVLIGQEIKFKLNCRYIQDVDITIHVSKYTKYIFKNMIEGSKSLQEIFDAIRKEFKWDILDAVLINECKIIFTQFFKVGILFLRDKSIAEFKECI